MSKLTKLINSPDKFFKDFIIKRVDFAENLFANGNQTKRSEVAKKTTTAVSVKSAPAVKAKVVVKKPVVKVAKIVEKFSFNFNSLLYAYQVNTLIHCGESLAVGQIICKDWIKYSHDVRKNVALVVRNLDLYSSLIKEYSHVNIVYAKSPTDLEKLLNQFDNLKQICYVSNTSNNIHLIRFNQYKHIFCGNFDLSRQPSAHKFFRVYDELWVNNQFTKDHLIESINIRHLSILNIGHPKSYNSNTFNKKVRCIYFKFNPDINMSESCLSVFIKSYEILLSRYAVYIENNNSKAMRDLKKYCQINDLDVVFGGFKNNLALFDVVFSDYKNDFDFEEIAVSGLPVFYFKPVIFEGIRAIDQSEFVEKLLTFQSDHDLYDKIHQLENKPSFLSEYHDFIKYRLGYYPSSKEFFLMNLKSLLVKENNFEMV